MKYPYKTILLLDGGGYKPGSEKWIRNQIGNNLLNVNPIASIAFFASSSVNISIVLIFPLIIKVMNIL